ncbi:MAG: AAA family ATPase [Casimicrobiaceae bacterium]
MTTDRGVAYLDEYFDRSARDPDVTDMAGKREIGWSLPPEITTQEWATSALTPRTIVERYAYADVALLIAPGGTGKTTLVLWEAIHIVLGRPLYGRAITGPGPVAIVTAEDGRGLLVARLRLIAEGMRLATDEIAIVMRDVRISDVSGNGLKLATVIGEAVIPSAMVDVLIAELQQLKPALVVFDPAISFGIGEARVNDAEQGLIEAARRVRNALNCCVRYVQHSGKANAREGKVDQYAGRGGSAMADGSRMVAVLQPMTPGQWSEETGDSLLDGETGMVLALPKLSYCPPQPDILITRKGYVFSHTTRIEIDAGAMLTAQCGQVIQALEHASAKGNQPTQRSLEAMKFMPRVALRDALAILMAHGRVIKVRSAHKGGAQHHLQLQAAPTESGAPIA